MFPKPHFLLLPPLLLWLYVQLSVFQMYPRDRFVWYIFFIRPVKSSSGDGHHQFVLRLRGYLKFSRFGLTRYTGVIRKNWLGIKKKVKLPLEIINWRRIWKLFQFTSLEFLVINPSLQRCDVGFAIGRRLETSIIRISLLSPLPFTKCHYSSCYRKSFALSCTAHLLVPQLLVRPGGWARMEEG